MTKLIKAVTRRTAIETRNAKPEEFAITLYPNGTIGFRKKGARTEVRTTLGACYAMAVKAEWADRQKEKQKKKRGR